nr:11829_t:CDS:2 [Entrophospora candida]
MTLKSQEGYEAMKKFVKEKLNPYLQNFIATGIKQIFYSNDKHNKKEEVIAAKRMLKESGIELDKKALSASTLTRFLREEEYKKIPKHILLKAAERGKLFHETIQDFIQTGNHPPFIDSAVATDNLSSEKLHYVFYKGELLATYLDLEFQDYVVELKTSNIKANESPLALLIFEIQLLIQYLCTGKTIYLL